MPEEQPATETSTSDETGIRNAKTHHNDNHNNKNGDKDHDQTTTNDKDSQDDNDNNNRVEYVDVLIVGAGVSGLQCARSLLESSDDMSDDLNVLILEARHRIGGRVHTTPYTVPQQTMVPTDNKYNENEDHEDHDDENHNNNQEDSSNNTVLWIDQGAAWVHGVDPVPWPDPHDAFHVTDPRFPTLLRNPVLDYLNASQDLRRVVRGNPWTRPYTVLHRTHNLALFLEPPPPTSQLAHKEQDGPFRIPQPFLYMKQPPPQQDSESHNTNRKKNRNNNNNNDLIRASIRRHYQIMRRVDQQVQTMVQNGLAEHANNNVSLQSALEHWNASLPLQLPPPRMDSKDALLPHQQEQQQRQVIWSLTLFYQQLLTYWQGFSLKDIPIAQYGNTRLDPDDDRNRNYSSSSSSSSEDDKDNSNEEEDDPLWDDEEFEQDGDFVGAHCTVQGGMHKVVQALATPDVRHCIRLDQEVIRIQHLPQHPTMTTNGGHHPSTGETSHQDNSDNETQTIQQKYNVRVETKSGSVVYAKACVVTIPVGCLRENHATLFANTTSLSTEKLQALERLTMGRYKKVFLTFDDIFWPTQPAFLGMMLLPKDSDDNTKKDFTNTTDNPLGNCLLLDNLWAKDGVPCIEAILAGDQGVWATHKSDEVIRNAVLDFLQTAMNLQRDLRQACVDCHVTRWEEDEYCRGAYAGLSMGGSDHHCQAMQIPEWNGSLCFAGDASSLEFEGSVPAAIFSGRYTAQRILEFLGRPANTKTLEPRTTQRATMLVEDAPESPIYDDYSWRNLPPHVQEAAMILGYTPQLWDMDEEPPTCDKSWRRLTAEEKCAATLLGYNKQRWNSS